MHIVIDGRGRRSSSGRYIDRLIEHLQVLDSENRYTILLEPDDNWKPSAKNFTATTCSYKKFSFNPLDQVTFASYLKKLQPDLVHFWMTPQEPAFYNGVRITTTHDLTMLRYARPGRFPFFVHWIRMAGYRWAMNVSHKKAKHIIVPSEFVKADIVALWPELRSKISVTYEATEPELSAKAQKPRNITKPFIFHVGSPFPHKNIERLVDAFTELKQNHPDLQLVLAGKQEFYFNRLEDRIASHPNKEDIIVTGFVSDGELKWLYENAECYVLPSLSEGFGLPGLEAMVHSCALASSNATCLPEIYGDAAHYFDPESTEDMTMKIGELLTNKPLREKLIKAGHKQVKKFSWQKMAELTLQIYKNSL